MTPRGSNNNKPNGEITRVAVVTGTSSGIGFETALTLARNGFYTYATMRNLKKSTSIKEIANKEALPLKVIELDVDDDDLSAKNAIQEIISENQRIDILVNNAGYGLIGPIEDISIEEEIKPQFETNLYGVIRVTQQVLPIMRRKKSGRIINESSIGGGIVGYPFSAAYCSTKFALEGLSESLSYEVDQFGIKVILIEPALVISDFHNNVKMAVRKEANNPDDSPYTQMMQKLFEEYKQVEEQYQIPAEKVAKVILSATILDNPDLRYQKREQLSTGSKNLDVMLGGGIETGAITQFYGRQEVGKHSFVILYVLIQPQNTKLSRLILRVRSAQRE